MQHIYWTLLTGSYEVQLSVYLPVSEEFFLVTVYEFFLGFSTWWYIIVKSKNGQSPISWESSFLPKNGQNWPKVAKN